MRRRFSILALSVMLLCCSVSLAPAQILPWNIGLDAAFRTGYLFGWQTLKETSAPLTRDMPHGTDLRPSLFVLSGNAEISPAHYLSARLGGGISVAESTTTVTRVVGFTTDGAAIHPWDVRPQYSTWEAAALVHLWRAQGYRFSFVGGFRQEVWDYAGDPSGLQTAPASFSDTVDSTIPFFGLQTAVFFPWWKARFEIIGSPFMQRDFESSVRSGASFVRYTGSGDEGGLIEFQMEGTVALTHYLRIGLFARYSHQDLRGEATGNSSSGTVRRLDISTSQAFGELGVHFNFLF